MQTIQKELVHTFIMRHMRGGIEVGHRWQGQAQAHCDFYMIYFVNYPHQRQRGVNHADIAYDKVRGREAQKRSTRRSKQGQKLKHEGTRIMMSPGRYVPHA